MSEEKNQTIPEYSGEFKSNITKEEAREILEFLNQYYNHFYNVILREYYANQEEYKK